MYSGDAKAQRLVVETLDAGLEKGLRTEERMFLNMPLLHAENLAMQERGILETRGDIVPGVEHEWTIGATPDPGFTGVARLASRRSPPSDRRAIPGPRRCPQHQKAREKWVPPDRFPIPF